MSLRTRLLLLVALATLVPAILLGVRFFQNRAAEIEAALTKLSMQAGNIAGDLHEKIQGTAQLQFGLSRAVNLDSADRAECSALLSGVREKYEQYTGILTITPQGRLFCDSLQTSRELDLRDRDYFKRALQTTEAVTLQPAVGRLTGASVLQIAYPARAADGELKFVLLASFNLQKFVDFHSQRLSGVDILLVEKNGNLLAAPSASRWHRQTGISVSDTEMFRLVAEPAAMRAKEVTATDGSQQVWASRTMPDAGLYIMVGASKDGLVAAANKRLFQESIVLGIVSAVLFAGVWGLAATGMRQIRKIAAAAKQFGNGDLNSRIGPPYPRGELGGLMVELNAAADALQRQHANIDELNRKLRKSKEVEARTKAFLDTVIDHIPNPISVKAPPAKGEDHWQFTLVNKAYEAMNRLPREQIVGKTAHQLYRREAADFMTASDAETLGADSGVVTGELPFSSLSDDPRIVSSKRVAIRDGHGKPQYILTVLEDVTESRLSEEKIAHMAHHDALTDLPNRAAFNICVATTLEKAKREDKTFSILSMDLARFKETNDVYGHATGDALLQEVARRLLAVAGDNFAARIGGDEFILIVTGEPQPETAMTLAKRLLVAFDEDFEVDGKTIHIGLGIGGAVYPQDGTDAKTLIIHADAALYRAKAATHTSLLFFEPEMGLALQERHNLQHDLRHAIGNNDLLLHYQPQFRITGEVIGFEALARWQSPARGMVPPATFIPIAEEYSLIIPLGEWALREACREASSWPEPLTIAVNVSPIQFHHGDLPGLVHSILLETGLKPARLCLEITEGVLINDFSRAVSILRRLKSLGVQIALDDFGKGYSSLSYLHAFAFDKIKIDRAFISDLENNHHSMAIVRAVIGLGQSLKVPILAEGVETECQRQFLFAEGCDEMQGYLAGRPYPIAHYTELVGRPPRDVKGVWEIAS
ncbi:MAG: EAL domain-containing protein [Pseudolabrys sp.]|nr:EAL domain-containing protein [Pseudolabrys sp.]